MSYVAAWERQAVNCHCGVVVKVKHGRVCDHVVVAGRRQGATVAAAAAAGPRGSPGPAARS